jgi:hypothetical protein
MIQAKEITNWIQAQSPRFMDDLEALVNVDCGTSNKTGVETVGRIFRSLLRADGFELTEFPLAEYGDCCLATLHSRSDGTKRPAPGDYRQRWCHGRRNTG